MSSRTPSENMKKMYAKKRQSTLNKIQSAIDEIQEDNRIVTKKELIEITGLSSGTFSQEYVKELLKENKVCQYRETITMLNSEKRKQLEEKSMMALKKENQKLVSKMQDFEVELERINNKNRVLREDYDKLNTEHILLKGKYQQLLEYLDALGFNLEDLPSI